MDEITLTFPKNLNVSAQIGDVAYFVDSSNTYQGDTVNKIGVIIAINQADNSITCNIPSNEPRPTENSFILFSKDNTNNMGSVLGYYATVQFRNDSTDYAEIFSVGSQVFESSK